MEIVPQYLGASLNYSIMRESYTDGLDLVTAGCPSKNAQHRPHKATLHDQRVGRRMDRNMWTSGRTDEDGRIGGQKDIKTDGMTDE